MKSFFRVPFNCESKVELVGNARKRFADQYDREWELYSYNQSPMLLNYFKENNDFIREQRENEELRKNGEVPLDDQYRSFIS